MHPASQVVAESWNLCRAHMENLQSPINHFKVIRGCFPFWQVAQCGAAIWDLHCTQWSLEVPRPEMGHLPQQPATLQHAMKDLHGLTTSSHVPSWSKLHRLNLLFVWRSTVKNSCSFAPMPRQWSRVVQPPFSSSNWGGRKKSVPPCRHQQPPWDSRNLKDCTIHDHEKHVKVILRSYYAWLLVIHCDSCYSGWLWKIWKKRMKNRLNNNRRQSAGCWSLPSQRTAPWLAATASRYAMLHRRVAVCLWGAIATWCFAVSRHSEYGARPRTSERYWNCRVTMSNS